MRIERSSFVNSKEHIDGKKYFGCRFEKSMLVFSGTAPVTLDGCTFIDVQWVFDGPAANTLKFMAGMYSGGAKELIEATFNNIRGQSQDSVGVKLN
jgi:hypothetical protein